MRLQWSELHKSSGDLQIKLQPFKTVTTVVVEFPWPWKQRGSLVQKDTDVGRCPLDITQTAKALH